MKKKTNPNIVLLRKIQHLILAKADQFQMSSVFSRYLDNNAEAGGCGTAACIAGWVLHLTSKNKKLNENKVNFVSTSLKRAGRLIGIPVKPGTDGWNLDHPLFFVAQWPEPFKSKYQDAVRAETMASIAADRISHFIKTGK